MKTIKLHHDRVNFVYSTDWHISTHPPGRREDDYKAAIFKKIEFVRDLAIKMNGVALCGGDVFHVKSPKSTANSIGMLVELLQLLRTFPHGHPYGTVGNHDIIEDRMDSLTTQPLGILIAAGAYVDLNVEPILFVNSDESIRVLVETFPYEHGAEALARLRETGARPDICTHRIALVHAYGESGDGGGMFGQAIGYNQLKGLDYDFMLWGHDHSRHETEEVDGITHVNLGSLARAAYEAGSNPSDDFDSVESGRPVVATILSFARDGIRYKEKEILVTPLKIAFRSADKKVADISKSDELKEFFAVMDEQVGDIEATDPGEVIKMLCPADDPKLLTLVMELCEI